jgi:hypothetical protein
MKKIFLTMTLAFATMFASAQFMALTTFSEGADSTWNATDKLGVGYQVNDKMMLGVTMDGEDNYELLGRYMVMDGLWATCVYNHAKNSEAEMKDKMEFGLGYSLKLWKNLYAEPNYTMPMKEDENGDREGNFNLSFSYRF